MGATVAAAAMTLPLALSPSDEATAKRPGSVTPRTLGSTISAVQAALDKVALGLLDDHAQHCIVGAPENDKAEKTDELMAAVARLTRR